MFGSVVLDVALGLIFVYLLLSLMVTAVTESVSGILRWRAQNLWEGVRNILDSGETRVWVDRLYSHPLVESLSALSKGGTASPRHGPSYIPSRTFAVALIEVLRAQQQAGAEKPVTELIRSLPEGKLKGTLVALADEAKGDLDELKKHIEIWFNNSMDRVSGWYKRKTQIFNLIIATAVVLAMNADTVAIARSLSINEALRNTVVAQAEVYAQKQSPEASLQALRKEVSGLGAGASSRRQPRSRRWCWAGC